MTYSESWPEVVTKAEALRELRGHSVDIAEFFEDLGDKEEYSSEEVLGWLGY
ncbi:hypothetical protein C4K35_1931 [Pseudomonas chlororaphis subsp. piscium]|uniref:hypothetical protein n=1 Tax=Pseudomonas chlororaphis TaxID=587753 RepID=UPI000F709504|nr:hypothetical protein [Pseudomonas chlororaphis]AZC49524.1 hypothetical protein C4K35_1931 [Pseudomonas chlororaphis subsp. piscium]